LTLVKNTCIVPILLNEKRKVTAMNTRLTVLALACSLSLVGCGTYHHNNGKHASQQKESVKVAKSVDALIPNDNAGIVVAQNAYKSEKPMVSNKVHFGFDKTTVSAEAKSELDKVAAYLADNQDAKVSVEGYTDVRGKASYNLALGMRRAQAVAQYLQEQGAQPSQVEVRSFGAERVAMTGDSVDVHAANRRAEVVFESDSSWG
jgi:peptidoglycan-associated lipoprotein